LRELQLPSKSELHFHLPLVSWWRSTLLFFNINEKICRQVPRGMLKTFAIKYLCIDSILEKISIIKVCWNLNLVIANIQLKFTCTVLRKTQQTPGIKYILIKLQILM
jgi:hypothetical protein